MRIGISGWRYAPWRGVFYPKGLGRRTSWSTPPAASSSIEINGSFYSLQRPAATGAGATRRRTTSSSRSRARVHHAHEEAARLERAARQLLRVRRARARREARAGPLAAAADPRLRRGRGSSDFFGLLPRTTARQPSSRAATTSGSRAAPGSTSTRTGRSGTRSRCGTTRSSTPGFLDLLREHDIAAGRRRHRGQVAADPRGDADFAYVRLHGDKELYASGYADRALDAWAALVRGLGRGGDRRLRVLRQRHQGPRAVRRDGAGRAARRSRADRAGMNRAGPITIRTRSVSC